MIGQTISHYRIVERLGGGGMGEYLYFTWNEDDGDVWVMDVEVDD